MITKQNGQGSQETRWFYMGPDKEIYGPYTGKDMMFWAQSGYFTETLPVRTENETQYHTLGEWSTLCNGSHPFGLNVFSMESLIQQVNQMRTGPPMMMMPQAVAPPFPPPQVRFPHSFMPLQPVLHQQMTQNGPVPQQSHNLHSQPPSEPIDAGSLSHTPDSENDIRSAEYSTSQRNKKSWMYELGLVRPNEMAQKAVKVQEKPKCFDAGTETDRVNTRDSSVQTEPITLSKANAIRVLSEILGLSVVIN